MFVNLLPLWSLCKHFLAAAVNWNSFREDGAPTTTEKNRRIVPLPFAATPEPSSLALLATVVAVVWRVGRKRGLK
jgi:hypothetical protein